MGLLCQNMWLAICLHSVNNCSVTRGLPVSIVSFSFIHFSHLQSFFFTQCRDFVQVYKPQNALKNLITYSCRDNKKE